MVNSSTSQAESKANSHARQRILHARHHDPFSFLGQHANHGDNEHKFIYRAFLPSAGEVFVKNGTTWVKLEKTHRDGLFELDCKTALPTPALLKVQSGDHSYEVYDPYTFDTSITQDELHLFGEGRLKQAYKTLGAQCMTQDNIPGVRFAVWAPNAERVSVIGNFNNWDGRIHSMRAHGSSGVWDIFIPGLTTSDTYKF